MTPQEKCVSLDTARKLKEAGFPQNTERWWTDFDTAGGVSGASQLLGMSLRYENDLPNFPEYRTNVLAAPDAQEIGELLPAEIGGRIYEQCKAVGGSYSFKYTENCLGAIMEWEGVPYAFFKNEAEARASAWLYLKENNLL